MFGHDDKNDDQHTTDHSGAPVISPTTDEPGNATNDSHDEPAASAPTFDTSSVSLSSNDTSSDSPAVSAPDDDKPADAPTLSPTPSTPVASDDLISIKQEALQQLSPLVDHLDQTPEEKFRTTMMMIQASDDQSLVGAAYAAAKQISDDKIRAQALLDIINEINYFTQKASS